MGCGSWGGSPPRVSAFSEKTRTPRTARFAPITELRGVVLEIFSRDQQVMELLLPDAGPPELWASMTAP